METIATWFSIVCAGASLADADGHTTVSRTPKVTGKGQTYFTNLFLKPTLEAGA